MDLSKPANSFNDEKSWLVENTDAAAYDDIINVHDFENVTDDMDTSCLSCTYLPFLFLTRDSTREHGGRNSIL